MLPSHQNLTKGKKRVLANLLQENMGEHMIACVDADYDYLLQGATPTSKTVVNNAFVLHTYAYAIENLQCYAPSLHRLCVMATPKRPKFVSIRAIFRKLFKNYLSSVCLEYMAL